MLIGSCLIMDNEKVYITKCIVQNGREQLRHSTRHHASQEPSLVCFALLLQRGICRAFRAFLSPA